MAISASAKKNVPEVIKKIRELFETYKKGGVSCDRLFYFVKKLVALDDAQGTITVPEKTEKDFEPIISLALAQEACKDNDTTTMLIDKMVGGAFCKLLITCFFEREGLTEDDAIGFVRCFCFQRWELKHELKHERMMIYLLLLKRFACNKKEFLTRLLTDVRNMKEAFRSNEKEEDRFQSVLKAISGRLCEQINALSDEELIALLELGHQDCFPAIADFVLTHPSAPRGKLLQRLLYDKDLPERMELIKKTAATILKEPAGSICGDNLYGLVKVLDDSEQCLRLKQEAVKRLAFNSSSSESLLGVLRYLPEEKRNEIAGKWYEEFCRHPMDYNSVNVLCALATQNLERELTERICSDLLKMGTCGTMHKIMGAVSEASDSPEKLNAIAESAYADTPTNVVSALIRKKDKLSAKNKKRIEKIYEARMLVQEWEKGQEEITELLGVKNLF